MLMSWHQLLFGTSKIWNWFFLLSASTLARYFNLRIHQCPISMVFSMLLRTAYMLLCVQLKKFRLLSNVLILKDCTKEPVSTSSLYYLVRMHQKALFKICFENLPLAGGCSCAPPATSLRLSLVTSALPKTRIHYCSNIKHIEKKYNIQIWNNIPGIISGGFYNKQWPTMKSMKFIDEMNSISDLIVSTTSLSV